MDQTQPASNAVSEAPTDASPVVNNTTTESTSSSTSDQESILSNLNAPDESTDSDNDDSILTESQEKSIDYQSIKDGELFNDDNNFLWEDVEKYAQSQNLTKDQFKNLQNFIKEASPKLVKSVKDKLLLDHQNELEKAKNAHLTLSKQWREEANKSLPESIKNDARNVLKHLKIDKETLNAINQTGIGNNKHFISFIASLSKLTLEADTTTKKPMSSAASDNVRTIGWYENQFKNLKTY